MASMNTRLNIKKLDENIVQKHGGLKQVRELKGDCEAGVFQVSNDDTAVAQRRLEEKQPEEKTNIDCLVKEQERKYQTGWKIKTGLQQQNGLVDETNVTLFAKVPCFLIQSGLSKFVWAEDTTRSTYLVNRSPSSAIGFKKPIDILGFFGWLASIKQGNMRFNESEEYKKTFIGSGVVRVQCRCYNNEAAFVVAAVEKIYAHESVTFNNIVACEVISKWKTGLKDDMDARLDVYVLSNGCRKCSDDSDGYYWGYTPVMFIHLFLYIDDMVFFCGCKAEIWATKGLLDKAKGNVLGMEIVRDQSVYTLSVSQSRFYNEKLVQTLLEGHSILSLKGSLSGDCNVEKNDVDMLDKFDHGLQINVVFVDFEYAMGRSITVMGIATGALVKGGSRSEVPAQVEVAAYRY
nr:zinc finger, CCHC-type [Tanacetum cinerariifolium]